jgi:hypothetical protein
VKEQQLTIVRAPILQFLLKDDVRAVTTTDHRACAYSLQFLLRRQSNHLTG